MSARQILLAFISSLLVCRGTTLPNREAPSISLSTSRTVQTTVANDYDGNSTQRPNIVVILADDMGWNDVSFHGSDQIPTPNIDALAYNGVILNNHYVLPLCTPSRAALLTGKYPIHLGMQHSVIFETEPRGLPIKEKLLPQHLKDVGYKTHIIGKWHLGYHRHEFTPTFRGFDSHFGYFNGYQDYYNHEVQSSVEGYRGFDMRRNLTIAHDTAGKYSTDLFTEEAIRLIDEHNSKDPMFLYMSHLAVHAGTPKDHLQAPDDEIAKFNYIENPERRIYAAMVSRLDKSVGEVVAALRRRKMLDNSIIVFMSDNGAPTIGIYNNTGSNYPLRGIKESPWEGAVRGVAAVWSPLIKNNKRVSTKLFSVVDWLPTFYSAIGSDPSKLGEIDGVSQWESLVSDGPSARQEVLINIDDKDNYAAIVRGDFKYVIGSSVGNNEWYGETGRSDKNDDEGKSPDYKPDDVLSSRVGIAISAFVTSQQMLQLKKIRGGEMTEGELNVTLLNSEDVYRLRNYAEVRCNVKEEDKVACNPFESPCLFSLKDDPCELVNLAKSRPIITAALEESLMKHRLTALPASNVPLDPMSNPIFWNGNWVMWKDPRAIEVNWEENKAPNKISGVLVAAVAVAIGLGIITMMTLIAIRYNCRREKCSSGADQGNFYQVHDDVRFDNVLGDQRFDRIDGGKTVESAKDIMKHMD